MFKLFMNVTMLFMSLVFVIRNNKKLRQFDCLSTLQSNCTSLDAYIYLQSYKAIYRGLRIAICWDGFVHSKWTINMIFFLRLAILYDFAHHVRWLWRLRKKDLLRMPYPGLRQARIGPGKSIM
jgi:hypothetical protein